MRATRRGDPRSLRRHGAVLACLALAACQLPHAAPRPTHFAAQPDPTVGGPPLADLFLWLEFGDETMRVNPAGRVTEWRDARGMGRAAVAQLSFTGTRVAETLRSPSYGTSDRFAALRCGDGQDRCAYAVRDLGSPPTFPTLNGLRYTAFAVVRRASNRGDNYFLMTSGTGCSAEFGGTGCQSGTVLHLGWSGPLALKHGHYDDDVVVSQRAGAADAEGRLPLSLITARFQMGRSDIAVLDSANNVLAAREGALALTGSGNVLVGGAPFLGGAGPGVPDWHFEGDIFALLIYTGTMTDADRQRVESYLRNSYGPR